MLTLCAPFKVLVDGVDIRELDLRWLRSKLGVVSQEPTLFSGTVRMNIGIVDKSATEKDIVRAAKLANAHDFLQELPDVSQLKHKLLLQQARMIKVSYFL